MQMYELAKNILSLSKDNKLNKVRFAKTIYFVHKELIRSNLASKDSFRYIRMPLGPVPQDFMDIDKIGNDIKVEKINSPRLQFDAFSYSTNKPFKGSKEVKSIISSTLIKLQNYQTSNLVEASHMDPSWLSRPNGIVYSITDDDLKNGLEILEITKRNTKDENDAMRRALINGMLKDIVEETTNLEYSP